MFPRISVPQWPHTSGCCDCSIISPPQGFALRNLGALTIASLLFSFFAASRQLLIRKPMQASGRFIILFILECNYAPQHKRTGEADRRPEPQRMLRRSSKQAYFNFTSSFRILVIAFCPAFYCLISGVSLIHFRLKPGI